MNCWIVLLLLCCCGKNNGAQADLGCGCVGHEHHNHHDYCHNSCIQPRMYERECDCEEVKPIQPRNDGCGCGGEERGREKWMPYTECSDNERRDCNCR